MESLPSNVATAHVETSIFEPQPELARVANAEAVKISKKSSSTHIPQSFQAQLSPKTVALTLESQPKYKVVLKIVHCPICIIRLANEDLNKHIEMQHNIKGYFDCIMCLKKLNTMEEYKTHVDENPDAHDKYANFMANVHCKKIIKLNLRLFAKQTGDSTFEQWTMQ